MQYIVSKVFPVLYVAILVINSEAVPIAQTMIASEGVTDVRAFHSGTDSMDLENQWEDGDKKDTKDTQTELSDSKEDLEFYKKQLEFQTLEPSETRSVPETVVVILVGKIDQHFHVYHQQKNNSEVPGAG